MKSNSYLYGKNVEVDPIPSEIADDRIEKLKANLAKEGSLDFMIRDDFKVKEIKEAIKYWEKMKTGEGI